MIKYKLHHIGILCNDTTAVSNFYIDILNHELCARFYNRGEFDLTFLGSGSELYLELVGRPFSDREQAYFDERGAGFHHLAFQVEDADAAFAELQAKGLKVAWEPDDFLFVRHFGVFDDNGLLIEVLEEKEPLAKPQKTEAVDFLLHHFDIFSDDWRRTKQFYADTFGLQSVFEYIYDEGGAFIYLADSFFDADSRQAMIEVIGPPYKEPREFDFSKRFGTGLDHIGYVVADVQTAYQFALARGSTAFVKPYVNYGTEMCWIQDANGSDLEIMLPVSKQKLQEAFESKRPYQPHNTSA
ncbi:MAG: VOC family protein [Chloroflexota bacterium]